MSFIYRTRISDRADRSASWINTIKSLCLVLFDQLPKIPIKSQIYKLPFINHHYSLIIEAWRTTGSPTIFPKFPNQSDTVKLFQRSVLTTKTEKTLGLCNWTWHRGMQKRESASVRECFRSHFSTSAYYEPLRQKFKCHTGEQFNRTPVSVTTGAWCRNKSAAQVWKRNLFDC